MTSMLVGDERPKPRETRSTKKLPIPASLVYQVHKIVIFGTLVAFLAAVVRNWKSIGYRNFVESVDDYVAKNNLSSTRR